MLRTRLKSFLKKIEKLLNGKATEQFFNFFKKRFQRSFQNTSQLIFQPTFQMGFQEASTNFFGAHKVCARRGDRLPVGSGVGVGSGAGVGVGEGESVGVA